MVLAALSVLGGALNLPDTETITDEVNAPLDLADDPVTGLVNSVKVGSDGVSLELDNGKTLAEARGDVGGVAAVFAYYAGWPTKIEGETIPVSRPIQVATTATARRSGRMLPAPSPFSPARKRAC